MVLLPPYTEGGNLCIFDENKSPKLIFNQLKIN
jgi:hypothetical protein